jgi:excisionase family DNA binding protein
MGKRKQKAPANEVPVSPILLTIEQVAAALQVSRNQVYRHIKHNGLPTVKIDNGFMKVSRASLERWIAEHEQAG